MSPFLEVLYVTAEEVLFQIPFAEVDVALGLVEVSQDPSAENGAKKLADVVPACIAIGDLLALLRLPGHVSVEVPLEVVSVEPWVIVVIVVISIIVCVRLLIVRRYLAVVVLISLSFSLFGFLSFLLLFLLLLGLFEVLLGFILCLTDLCLLLLDFSVFLQLGCLLL